MSVAKEMRMKKLTGEWIEYKEGYVQCSNVPCETWNLIRIKQDVELKDAGFLCGLCAFNEVKVLKEKLSKSVEVVKEVEKLRSGLDEKAKEIQTSVNENNDRRWETVERTRMNKNDRLMKENMRKEIKLVGEDDKRKKRVVVFGMDEVDGTDNMEQAEILLSKLNLDTEVGITEVFRLRKKEDTSKDKPLLIEFQSEKEKRMVLDNKASLRTVEGYKTIFLERDQSVEQRMERAKKFREKKKQKEEQEEQEKVNRAEAT